MSDTLSSRVDGMVAGLMLSFSRLVAGVQFFSLGFVPFQCEIFDEISGVPQLT